MKWFHKHKFKKVKLFYAWYESNAGKQTWYTAAEGYQCPCGERKVVYKYWWGANGKATDTPTKVQSDTLDWVNNIPEIKNNVIKLRVVK